MIVRPAESTTPCSTQTVRGVKQTQRGAAGIFYGRAPEFSVGITNENVFRPVAGANRLQVVIVDELDIRSVIGDVDVPDFRRFKL